MIWAGIFSSETRIIGLIWVLALIVRLPRITELDVWFDEVALLFQTQMSYSQIWTFCKDENFPPLYGWILKFWGELAPGDNWFRLLSALFGSIIPPVAYLLGREIKDRSLGLLLAGACLISLPLLFYAQNIRMYSLWVLMACFSYWALMRALKTNEWKYWAVLGISNLIGFYSFLTTIFILFAEIIIIIWQFRINRTRYFRAIVTFVPSCIIMALWFSTLFTRYEKVHEYVNWRLDFWAVYQVWTYMGTCTAWVESLKIKTLLNLPLLVGLIMSLPKWSKHEGAALAGALLLLGGGSIAFLSLVSHSMFFGRYLLYLLPLYLALSLYGWLTLRRKWWRVSGVLMVFFVLIASFVYHQLNYVVSNDSFRYGQQQRSVPGDDGHSFSRLAALVERRLESDEVIIHFTTAHVRLRCLAFFPIAYYHNRSLPEYIYSQEPIPLYCGGQYLHPGERIKSLHDFKAPPAGIWLITRDQPQIMDFESAESKLLRQKKGAITEDLPLELYEAGYRVVEEITDFGLSAVHLIKPQFENDGTVGNHPFNQLQSTDKR